VTPYAFDLLEFNGEDLRPQPLHARKARLEALLAKAPASIQFNEHVEGDGVVVFERACKLGLEGIVSKHRERPHRSGRDGPLTGKAPCARPSSRRVHGARKPTQRLLLRLSRGSAAQSGPSSGGCATIC
jgi:hypothetical protein